MVSAIDAALAPLRCARTSGSDRKARPDRTRTVKRRTGFITDFDPTPGLYTELVWQLGGPVATDHVVRIRLASLPPGTTVESDRTPVGAPVGRYRIRPARAA